MAGELAVQNTDLWDVTSEAVELHNKSLGHLASVANVRTIQMGEGDVALRQAVVDALGQDNGPAFALAAYDYAKREIKSPEELEQAKFAVIDNLLAPTKNQDEVKMKSADPDDTAVRFELAAAFLADETLPAGAATKRAMNLVQLAWKNGKDGWLPMPKKGANERVQLALEIGLTHLERRETSGPKMRAELFADAIFFAGYANAYSRRTGSDAEQIDRAARVAANNIDPGEDANGRQKDYLFHLSREEKKRSARILDRDRKYVWQEPITGDDKINEVLYFSTRPDTVRDVVATSISWLEGYDDLVGAEESAGQNLSAAKASYDTAVDEFRADKAYLGSPQKVKYSRRQRRAYQAALSRFKLDQLHSAKETADARHKVAATAVYEFESKRITPARQRVVNYAVSLSAAENGFELVRMVAHAATTDHGDFMAGLRRTLDSYTKEWAQGSPRSGIDETVLTEAHHRINALAEELQAA